VTGDDCLATMEGFTESEFMSLLSKYKVIRPRTADLGRLKRIRRSGPLNSASRVSGVLVQEGVSSVSRVELLPADFWKGLQRFLELRCSQSDAKAILQEFDKLHYKGLASLNWEDIEDFTTTMARELHLPDSQKVSGV